MDSIIFDSTAMGEITGVMIGEDERRLGFANDTRNMLHALASIDSIIGNKPLRSVESYISSRSRRWYVDMVIWLVEESGMGIEEISDVIDEVRLSKPIRKAKSCSAWVISNILMQACERPSTEPDWHMCMRGDHRKIPNGKYSLWSYLCYVYTNPLASDREIPQTVLDEAVDVRGYLQLLREARIDGASEIKSNEEYYAVRKAESARRYGLSEPAPSKASLSIMHSIITGSLDLNRSASGTAQSEDHRAHDDGG